MLINADQLLAHAIGDYVLQSDWMATEKTKESIAASCHALCYSLPFLIFRPSYLALGAICGTHFIIDRWRLARFVVYAKNFLSPPPWYSWEECAGTGYFKDRPIFLAVWLLIIADNVMHVLVNGLALKYL